LFLLSFCLNPKELEGLINKPLVGSSNLSPGTNEINNLDTSLEADADPQVYSG